MTRSSNEKGYTMIEVIMYTGLIIILTGAIASMVSNVFYRYKIGRINQQVIDIKKTIVYYTATWDNYGEYDDDTNPSIQNKHFLSFEKMQQDNVLPMELKNGIHALAGGIEAGSAINYKDITGNTIADTDDVNNKYMYYIRFNGLSPDACIEVITQGPFYSDSSDLDSLIVNDRYMWKYQYSHFALIDNYIDTNKTYTLQYTGEVEPGTSKTIIPAISLSISDAIKACDQEKNNFITWIFS